MLGVCGLIILTRQLDCFELIILGLYITVHPRHVTEAISFTVDAIQQLLGSNYNQILECMYSIALKTIRIVFIVHIRLDNYNEKNKMISNEN